MPALTKITSIEVRLFFREPAVVFFVLLLPLALLSGFGMISNAGEPDPSLGGLSLSEYIASMSVALAVTILGLTVVPTALAAYREKGVLRRLATTPAAPGAVLTAQLIINVGTALFAAILLLAVGRLAFGIPLPADPGVFAGVFVLAVAALFGIGLLIGALAPSARASNGIGMILFFPSLFFAGVYIPWNAMPEVLRRISDFTPLGAALQALRTAWLGGDVRPLHLVIMAVYAVATVVLAARFFRWS